MLKCSKESAFCNGHTRPLKHQTSGLGGLLFVQFSSFQTPQLDNKPPSLCSNWPGVQRQVRRKGFQLLSGAGTLSGTYNRISLCNISICTTQYVWPLSLGTGMQRKAQEVQKSKIFTKKLGSHTWRISPE